MIDKTENTKQAKTRSDSRPVEALVRRTLRFRAWDDVNEAMYYDIEDIILSGGGFPCVLGIASFTKRLSCHGQDRQLELMQFTGLKDKNGKEIYECDIVKYYENEYLIVWNAEMAMYQLQIINGNDDDLFEFDNNEVMEVIGNVFETPELL